MTNPAIHINHLSYVSRLQTRALESIDLVVIHCTELPDLPAARNYGERIHYPDTVTGNSGHFYVERSGLIEQWVPRSRIAHHVKAYNERSIGIELDNKGRYPDWFDSRHQVMRQAYTLPQLDSLAFLLQWLSSEMPCLKWVTGHEFLDKSRVPASDNPEVLIRRKKDPGPQFPWQDLLPRTSLQFLGPEK